MSSLDPKRVSDLLAVPVLLPTDILPVVTNNAIAPSSNKITFSNVIQSAIGQTAGTLAAGNDARFFTSLQQAANLSDLGNKAAAISNLGLGNSAVLNVGNMSGTVAAGNDTRIMGALQQANNLSDVGNAPTARTNLGLGNSATQNIGTSAGTVAAGNDSRFTSALQQSNNLSDLTNEATARTNLGLGNASTLNVGTSTGTLAAGDDTRIVGAVQKSANLSDLTNEATARTNLGLGNSATQNVGTTSSTVAAGNDSRITGATQATNNLSDLASIPTARTNLGAGSASGLATLDGTGKLTSSQIPTSLIGANVYQGAWNASTNTPTITSGVGTNGYYYRVSVAGTTTVDGISTWAVGDTIIFNGTIWQKIPVTTSSVVSVAGRAGAVTLSNSDISGLGGAAVLNVGTTTGTLAAGDDSRFTSGLQKSSNLSDLVSATTARTNLGLGGSAVLNVGTSTGTLAAGDDTRIVGAAQTANNLSDLASATTARTNLGLGGASILNVGTSSSTVAAGNDSRIVGAVQTGNNLSDLANIPTARTNLGLGAAALLNVGTGSSTVAAGNDSRIVGAVQASNNLSDLASATTARTNLGLGNVQNTALSTWAGSTNITTLGAITAASIPISVITGLGNSAPLNVGQIAGTVAAGNDPRFNGGGPPTGTENYEACYNPFNAAYGAVGGGADDYPHLAACLADAVSKNAEMYIPQDIYISKTLVAPVPGFEQPYMASVNTSTSTITLTEDPGGNNGDPIQFQGACPAGIIKGTQYFRFFPTPSNRLLVQVYNTRPNALAGGSTGKIAITADVRTTGSITGGSVLGTNNILTVSAELSDEVGTNVVISGTSGATGGFYIIGGIGTNTLTLNTTSKNTSNSSLNVTYVCYVDTHSFSSGIRIRYAPGVAIKKHHTWTTAQGNPVFRAGLGSDVEIIGGKTTGLSTQFIPPGMVTASCSNSNQVTITSGPTDWVHPGVSFTLGGGATTYFVNSISGSVITAAQTGTSAPVWPTVTNILVGQGISSGFVGLIANGTSGSSTVTLNTTDGLWIGYPIWFAGDNSTVYTVQTVTPGVSITVSPVLSANVNNAAVLSIGGDDGIDLSSCRHASIYFHSFEHCGDAGLRMESNVSNVQAKSTSYPNGGVSTNQVYVFQCNFYNVYQTSTTTNNFTTGGGRDIYFLYNKFEAHRGSIKFAGRVPGSDNINLIGNIITSSDNHGFEIDSQSDLRIYNNQIMNVFNQGTFVISNNGPTNVSMLATTTIGSSSVVVTSNTTFKIGMTGNIANVGPYTVTAVPDSTHITVTPTPTVATTNAAMSIYGLGVVGFPYENLDIQNNVYDNCGQMSGTCSIRITPDTYLDGSRYPYKHVTIKGNKIRNVTNTSHLGILLSGSFQDLMVDDNSFVDYQGLVGIQMSGRGETTSGFINAIRMRRNEINMNNASQSAFGIRIEQTSGSQPLNDITLDNEITGQCNRRYALGGSTTGLNNVKMFNLGKHGLGLSGLGTDIGFMNQTGTLKNFTVDGNYYLQNTTGGATATSLLWDTVWGSTSKALINPNETILFTARITARDTSGNSGAYKIDGCIKQGANASTTAIVGTPTVTTLAEDTSAASWNVAAVADTTLGALDIQVTGAASTTIHWTATVSILEQY